jgi:hypothetical protein
VLLANLCVDDDGTPCDPELAAQTANKSTLHVVLQVAQVSRNASAMCTATDCGQTWTLTQ